jgi:HD superfamily phosphodiesterase
MLNKFLAYGKERHALEAVMRIQAVKRWHMIDTTRTQNLAEHSANVAMLATLIALTAPINFFDDHIHVGAVALVHDLPEAFTGDIPSHTKKRLQGVDELEKIVTPSLFMIECRSSTAILVKMCDIADGIRFIRLHGVDMTAAHAQEGLEEQILRIFDSAMNEHRWPEHVIAHVKDHIMFYAYERS